MKRRLLRDRDARDLGEILLVSAVATVLAIRAGLHLSGYPRLGGGGLHIAHMLWGGAFMLAAIVLFQTWWNPAIRRTAAFLAGIGFGTFIDELGKFVTADNDYFYRPTVALLYVVFVAVYLALRRLAAGGGPTERERALNDAIRSFTRDAGATPLLPVRLYLRARRRVRLSYREFVRTPFFRPVVIAGVIAVSVSQIAATVAIVAASRSGEPAIPFFQAASTVVAAAFGVVGLARLPASRTAAYRWFRRSLLVSLFVTQVFVFYSDEFAALGGLARDLALYVALRQALRLEERMPPRPA